jgi:hypothetical protein
VIDARDLTAKGCLTPGWRGTGQWTDRAGAVHSFGLICEPDRLLISWHQQQCDGGVDPATVPGGGDDDDDDGSCSDQHAATAVSIDEIIPIVRTHWFWGGTRGWFLCPRTGFCGRRVLKLYFVHGRFQCRSCGRVIYRTPYEKPWQRAARRASVLRQRLGIAAVGVDASTTGHGGTPSLPEVPADIPVEVYAQQLEELLRAETAADEGRTEQLQRLVSRIPPRFTL